MEAVNMGLLLISSMMLLGGIYLIFALVWWILQIIANWNIFTKAGEAGWKSLIPIYGDYISYKIAWQTSYFWLSFILGIVASYVSSANLNESMFLTVIASQNCDCSDQYHILCKTVKSIWTRHRFCNRTYLAAADFLADPWFWF